MIVVRRAIERKHQGRKLEAWLTFDPQNEADPLAQGFGTVLGLDEVCLAGGARVPRPPREDSEMLTYVYQGVLAYSGAGTGAGVLQAGEFERMTGGRALRRDVMNGSRTHAVRFFQMAFRAELPQREPGCENQRFSAAERRDGLRVVASRDGRQGSLRLQHDAFVYSALLEPGQHVACALGRGRHAWLHVVQGEVTLVDSTLTAGDGAGIADDHAVSLTAHEPSEILLADVRAP
jgi:quercetin 2,3-dioxygenase